VSILVIGCGCGKDGGSGSTGPSNHAPVLQGQADTSLALGDTLVIWAEAHDDDGDDLTYTAAAHISFEEFMRGYFPDAGMNATSGRFEFRTREDDGPSREFTFSVDDGRGGTDSTTFWVRIH
jgi:hypothetical protein